VELEVYCCSEHALIESGVRGLHHLLCAATLQVVQVRQFTKSFLDSNTTYSALHPKAS